MKLTKLSYIDVLKATKEELTDIVFEQENSEVQEKCDVGIILGSEALYKGRSDKGIELYKNGLVEKLAVTGGIGFLNHDRKTPEAHKMYEYLVERGIPKKDILVENESRDTRENMTNTLRILESRYSGLDVRDLSYAIITSDFHVRRSLGLFGKVLGIDEKITGSGVLDGKTDINSWYNSPYGRKTIRKEALLLLNFAKKNRFLHDIEISEEKEKSKVYKSI